MGFFSNRRNRIIEEEITNALLYSEGFHDTSIYWEAFEKFAKENGGKTDLKADGGHDTEFEMVTNGIEVKVMAFRYPTDGSTSIRVRTLAEIEKETEKFASDFALKARGGIPEDEEIEDEFEDEDEDEDEEIEDGEHIDYYDDGQIWMKSYFKNGLEVGKHTDYYEDGQVDSETNYKGGLKHGKETHWDEDGNIDWVENYKDGLKHGKQFLYDEGELMDDENYKDGKKHGEQIRYVYGELTTKVNYKDGKKHGKEFIYEDEELFEEFNYKDDEKDGEQFIYLNGEIDEVEIYKDGVHLDSQEENKPKSIMDELLEIPGVKEQKDLFNAVEKMNSDGSTSDEMSEGIGDFGLEPTNPIPTNGVHGSILYLGGLRAPDGSRVDNERIKTVKVENIKKIIDVYSIYHEDGSHITTIYISPYQAKNSKKAPKGLTQVSPLL